MQQLLAFELLINSPKILGMKIRRRAVWCFYFWFGLVDDLSTREKFIVSKWMLQHTDQLDQGKKTTSNLHWWLVLTYTRRLLQENAVANNFCSMTVLFSSL
jgi:hypothetical protein